MAIDLIVQHIRELLNYRNGSGSRKHREQQVTQQQQNEKQSQLEDNDKLNRHNSDSFSTRPH